MKLSKLPSKAAASALLIMAALIPAVATAACPQIGSWTLKGDCSPRSDSCYRWVAHEIRGSTQYGRIVLFSAFRRAGSSNWVYLQDSWAPCSQW